MPNEVLRKGIEKNGRLGAKSKKDDKSTGQKEHRIGKAQYAECSGKEYERNRIKGGNHEKISLNT